MDANGTPKTASPEETLRDKFAMAALSGWLASYSANQAHPCADADHAVARATQIAAQSYALADAMMRVRSIQKATPQEPER